VLIAFLNLCRANQKLSLNRSAKCRDGFWRFIARMSNTNAVVGVESQGWRLDNNAG
jgi:hypothetical protein